MLGRSDGAKNECILEIIDTGKNLINVSHFEQTSILLTKYPSYYELVMDTSDFLVRKYEKVIYRSYKRKTEEDA